MTLLGRIDGRINPIVVKELRQAVRGRFVVTMISLSLLAQLAAVAAFLATSGIDAERLSMTPSGSKIFPVLFALLFGATILFLPLYSGVRMAAERSDANVELLFITTIRPRTIVLGKLLTVAILTALIFSASLPFLVFSYVLRGIDVPTILILLIIAFFLVCTQSIVAMFLGCLPVSKPFKFVVGGGLLMFTATMYIPAMSSMMQMVRYSGGSFSSAPGLLWKNLAVWLAVALVADVVLLVLTTALIAPSTANRALPIRITLVALWTGSLMLATRQALKSHDASVLTFWAVVQASLGILVLLSAIGERERWGARVARTIPANGIARALAFLFYSGGGGGTLWAMLFVAATLVAHEMTVVSIPPRWSGTPHQTYLVWFVEAALALFAYALTALLLRRTLLRHVPARTTWAIALLLFLILVVVPPLLVFALLHGDPLFKSAFNLATILNPFPRTDAPANVLRTLLLGGWAIAAFAANARWIAEQWLAFRPPPAPALFGRDADGASLALQEISRP
jgi:hypothetical protein